MTFEEFEDLFERISYLCDRGCRYMHEKQEIENSLINLWNEYKELKYGDQE